MAKKNEQSIIIANLSHDWVKFTTEREDEDGYIFTKITYVCNTCGLKAFNNSGTNCPSLNSCQRDLANLSCIENTILNVLK